MEFFQTFDLKTITFVGFTLQAAGEVLVGFTAIMVHYRFWQEHKIDSKVFAEMKREQVFGLIGIILIVAGYLLQIPSRV